MKINEHNDLLVQDFLDGKQYNLLPYFDATEVIAPYVVEHLPTNHEIPASLVRNVLLGKYNSSESAIPRGLRIRGARILGRLDLEGINMGTSLELISCHIPHGINARSCEIDNIKIENCLIGISTSNKSISSLVSEPDHGIFCLESAEIRGEASFNSTTILGGNITALDADGLTVHGDFTMTQSTAKGKGSKGTIRLTGARINGQLDVSNSGFHNDSGPALSADELIIGGNAFLDEEFIAVGSSKDGAIRMLGVEIGGQLSFSGATVTNHMGSAIIADRIQIKSDLFIDDSFTAIGAGKLGTIGLLGGSIGGQVNFSGAKLTNTSGPALAAFNLSVNNDIHFGIGSKNKPFTASGHGQLGALRLVGAQIGGSIIFRGAKLENLSGNSIIADGVSIGRDLTISRDLSENTIILGTRIDGGITMVRGQVGGEVRIESSILKSWDSPALNAESAIISGGFKIYENSRISANGNGTIDGSVRLAGAQVGGQLRISNSTILNSNGPAISADSLSVKREILLDKSSHLNGSGKSGTFRLINASIEDRIKFSEATISNYSGQIVDLEGITVNGPIIFGRELVTIHTPDIKNRTKARITAINMKNAKVREVQFHKNVIESAKLGSYWDLTGFRYESFNSYLNELDTSDSSHNTIVLDQWLDLLLNGTSRYSPQPFQQLAKVARESGYERISKEILVAYRREHLSNSGAKLSDRIIGRLGGVTLGYGYDPARPVLWLGILFIIAFCVSYYPGLLQTVRSFQNIGSFNIYCSFTEHVLVAFDMTFPLISSGVNETCQVSTRNGSSSLQALAIGTIVIKLFGWILTAILVAGFAGVIRRDHQKII